ncbi:MAG: sensor histidine kinase [Roseobacter sp.]
MTLPSLRSRLIVIILTPLLFIAALAGAWQFSNATERAEDIFDRGLLSAALAISRDVAVSDGDALSPATRALVNNTSGGELFYHVYAPDGVFVTGYSTPPILPQVARAATTDPLYYDARYQGRDVRVLLFQDITTVSEIAGVFNITVWQNADVRRTFVQDVVVRSYAVIALFVVSVALVVWFGVGVGLQPLLELEDAIAKRSPTELEPIQRDVPAEAKGLVTTLNALLDRVSRRISSKDEFISNAAHQLRNPVAGILALAEAVQNAPNTQAAKKRSAELVDAARQASDLTNQLLSFERAAGSDLSKTGQTISLNAMVDQVADRFEQNIMDRDIRIIQKMPDSKIKVYGDPIMIEEALLNLLNNAAIHGGPQISAITLDLTSDHKKAVLTVLDDGVGIPDDKHALALNRFSQADGGPGTGLGLPISVRVMTHHGGSLKILSTAHGTGIELTFPLV